MKTKYAHSRLYDELILHSWWMILFFLLVLFVYDKASSKRLIEKQKLEAKLSSLCEQKKLGIEKREILKRQLLSQNDPKWIELVLIKELGLVPEGQKKVVFKSP